MTEAQKKKHRLWEKSWYEANKEKVLKQRKEYCEANKEMLKKRREATREKRLQQGSEYRKANKETLLKSNRDYVRYKRATDPAYKLMASLRNRHRAVLKEKASTTEGLGCDSKFFRHYISAQWTEGMSWDNYGNKERQWSLDHILPLDLLNTNPELLPKLIHYSNMQPMWHVENQKKSNKI